MVSVAQIKTVTLISLLSLLAACESTDRREVKQEKDIYTSLKQDEVEYHQEEKVISKGSPEYLVQGMNDLRALYYRKKYAEASDMGLRLIKLAPSLAEAYYWLARIAIDQADFQQAYAMAAKGLLVVEDKSMQRELEQVQVQAQMGAN